MQQRTGSIAGFYKSQVESAQDMTSASMEGFERIQQLALQAFRQQIDNQFRLVNTVAARSAEAVVDPELARPALERMIDVQRQMADTFVRTNQRVLSAVGSSAQRSVEHGNQQPSDIDSYSSMVQTAVQQWQELSNRMLDAFSQQFSAATGEIQRQGQRALDQTSEAVQSSVGGGQAGAQQAEPGAQGGQRPGQQGGQGQQPGKGGVKSPERKHEMA